MVTMLVMTFIFMTPAAIAFPIVLVYCIVKNVKRNRERKKIAEPYHKILHDAIERV